MKCEVLLGPVMLDRPYASGEIIELEAADANPLSQWGIIKILSDEFTSSTPPRETSPPIDTVENAKSKTGK